MVVASCAVERDEVVVVAAVHVDAGDDAGCRVDEVDDARCRLTHVRVMTLEVLASCIYRLEMISPCQDEKPIHPRPGFVLQLIYAFSPLSPGIEQGRLHRPSLPTHQRPGCMSQRVLSVLVVIIELGRLLPTESATMHNGAAAVGVFTV